MVSFGSWTQDDDYTVTDLLNQSSGPDWFDYAYASGGGESGWQDPAYELLPNDFESLFAILFSPERDNTGGVVSQYGAGYEWTYNLSFPEWNTIWAAWRTLRRFTLRSRVHAYLPYPQPPDAIGIEYDGIPYDPEDPFAFGAADVLTFGIAADTELAGHWEDTSNPNSYNLLDVATTVLMRPAVTDAPTLTIATLPPAPDNSPTDQERLLGEAVDLTAYLPASPGDIATIWSRPAQAYVTSYGDIGEVGSQARVDYGWGITQLQTEWSLRPPLYRWVFDTAPYRRAFPNDAATESARRTFPPSRAMQAGRRTSGGYI